VAIWLTGAFFSDATTTRLAMKGYIIGAAVTSLVGVVALHLPVPGAGFLLFDEYRAQGLFKDPNVFGPFLVPAACIALEEIARPRLLQWRRHVVVAVALVLVAGIVFAFSRAAWLNFLVAAMILVGVYGVRRRGLRYAARSLTVLAVAGLLGAAMLIGTGSFSFFESRTTLQGYDERRFETQGKAYSRIDDHIFGYGPGQSEALLGYAPHSTYARVSVEQGVAGLLGIIAIFGATFGAALRLAFRDADLHGIGSATLLAAWVGLVVNSFFVDTLHWRHLWIVAALIWCAVVARETRGALASKRSAPPQTLRSATLPDAGYVARRGAETTRASEEWGH
jgi:O-antigen ligase